MDIKRERKKRIEAENRLLDMQEKWRFTVKTVPHQNVSRVAFSPVSNRQSPYQSDPP